MSLKNNDRDEIWAMIQQALARANIGFVKSLGLASGHSWASGSGTASMTTGGGVVASVTVTPRVTGKYRVIGQGSVFNSSGTAATCVFQVTTQTTPLAAASVAFSGPAIDVASAGNGSGQQFGLVANTPPNTTSTATAGLIVSTPGVINIFAIPGTTNVLSIPAGAQIDVQEIF